jgi:hypothetical protein
MYPVDPMKILKGFEEEGEITKDLSHNTYTRINNNTHKSGSSSSADTSAGKGSKDSGNACKR